MLRLIVDWLVYGLFGLSTESRLADSINFFIYDSIKIMLLLFVMIAAIGFLRTYLPQEKVRKWLSGKGKLTGNLMASIFGAITPFCSCSSIPIFIGFIEAGVPLGTTFSFLITSPLVNEYLVVLMLGFFGLKITALYVLFGVLIGVLAGFILGELKLEKHLVKDIASPKTTKKEAKYDLGGRFKFGLNEAWAITKKLWIWILVGVGIGAIIHNYVPEEFINSIISSGGIFTVPLATVLGVPIYGSCAAIVPIAAALFDKGVPLGTSLAFMMAISALSLPEAVILRRAMRLRLLAIFFGIVTLAIIITGYVFNILELVI
jgi:uncharacterized protein